MALSWDDALKKSPLKINIGGRKQNNDGRGGHWPGYVSIDRSTRSSVWGIKHTFPGRLEFPDNVVDAALSEHFLEHLNCGNVRDLCVDVLRVLKPGSLFRIAVPDIMHPKQTASLKAGRDVTSRHHKSIWTYETMPPMLFGIGFETVRLKHYWDGSGVFHQRVTDYDDGWINRCPGHDARNDDGREYGEAWATSLVIDAYKAAEGELFGIVPYTKDGEDRKPTNETCWGNTLTEALEKGATL